MCSTDARRAPRRAVRALAALALAGALGACAEPGLMGEPDPGLGFGVANAANIAMHTGAPLSAAQLARLSDAFRAAAPDTVNFDFDSARLDAEAERVLAAQAAWLRAHPGALMRLEGHADLVGPERYNDRLGLRRARAVAARLAALGVDRARLRAVESRGMRDPVVPVEERERLNRRAVTLVEGWGRPDAGIGLDGKRARLAYDAYTADKSERVVLDTAERQQ
mgnify:CR=1 FL=1